MNVEILTLFDSPRRKRTARLALLVSNYLGGFPMSNEDAQFVFEAGMDGGLDIESPLYRDFITHCVEQIEWFPNAQANYMLKAMTESPALGLETSAADFNDPVSQLFARKVLRNCTIFEITERVSRYTHKPQFVELWRQDMLRRCTDHPQAFKREIWESDPTLSEAQKESTFATLYQWVLNRRPGREITQPFALVAAERNIEFGTSSAYLQAHSFINYAKPNKAILALVASQYRNALTHAHMDYFPELVGLPYFDELPEPSAVYMSVCENEELFWKLLHRSRRTDQRVYYDLLVGIAQQFTKDSVFAHVPLGERAELYLSSKEYLRALFKQAVAHRQFTDDVLAFNKSRNVINVVFETIAWALTHGETYKGHLMDKAPAAWAMYLATQSAK